MEREGSDMNWTKINPRTGEPAKRNCNSFEPHDYICESYRIVNKSFSVRKGGWILTKDGNEIKRFDTLKSAKAYAENN